jgi:cytochrome c oxidase subunit 4
VHYVLIFCALVVLTIVTLLIALHRFENELTNVIAALAVASIKAAFVALYFMHLKFEGRLIYVILAVPIILTIGLVLSLIPDVGHGMHHVIYAPPITHPDAIPMSHY